jgi:cell fate (sporulation/competence/biofilm development) regulator YmcA (YheA/YmcA/DUF963 family)
MIKDKSIRQRISSAKTRIKKLASQVNKVKKHQDHAMFIQKVGTLETYIYSKIDPFDKELSTQLLSEIKELRLDAQHFLDLGISYIEYQSSTITDNSSYEIKQYKKELKLAATLAGY